MNTEFNKNFFIFNKQASIDSKSRIILPVQTGLQKNDLVVFQESNYGNPGLIVSPYDTYYRLLEIYDRIINTTVSYEELKLAKQEMELLCLNMLGTAELDKQRRVLLPHDFVIENEWEQGPCLIRGLGHSVLIEQPKQIKK